MMKKIVLIIVTSLLLSCSNDDSPKSVDEKQSAQHSSAQSTPDQTTGSNVTESRELNINPNTAFKVLSVSEGIYDNTNALQINFNLPVKKGQDFGELIKVLSDKKLIKTDWIFSDNQMALYFPFIEAETQYEVNISQSLNSTHNKSLVQSAKVTVNTQAAKKVARFVSRGNTLLSSDDELPIEAVNVDAVELKFWKINQDSLYSFLQNPNKRDIYSLNQLNDVAQLVHTSHFELDEVKNKTENHNLPIDDIDVIKSSGVYFVTMMPDDAYEYEFESTWFIQTDLGLHTRVYKNTVAVFVHQLPAANVYPNVKVTLMNDKNEIISEGVTDNQGYVTLSFNDVNKIRYVMGAVGEAINLVRLSQPKLDLSEFKLSNRRHYLQELFLYAPRDLYRPGETAQVNGLLRDEDGHMVTASPIKVEIKRPDNRLFRTFSWQGDESGYYQTSFAVPNDAMTGAWSFNAELADGTKFNYEINVEDFLPERLKLDLSAGNTSSEIPVSESPKINIQSDYLYGAPADGNRFDATVSISTATDLFEDYDEYHFGSNHYTAMDSNYTTDAAVLNEQGFAELALPIKWQNTTFPLQISSHVNVYESGGRPIARQIKQTVWPHPFAVGVKPEWEGRFASPNRNNTVALIAVDSAGESIALENAEIMLIQENQERYWHWGDNGWGYRNNNKEIPVYNAVINIEKNGDNLVSLPLNYGSYRIEVRTQDQTLISSYRLFSGWQWYDPYASKGEKPDQVKLAWQSDHLTQGEVASLKVTAPYAGTAIVTVESDDLLWHKTVTMTDAEQLIEVPIDNSWRRHDIHASVMVIKAGSDKKGRSHLPKRSIGVTHLPLNRADRKLDLEIIYPEKTLPDETVTVTVKAKNMDASQATFVTLAAVDTGVLNVSRFETPKPFEWFFAKRAYFPSLRDVYGSLIEMIEAKSAQQKFGGDADISRGGDEAKADVQIVSIFSGKVAFDQAGEANIDLKLPYFNGELRLMAVAFNEHQFAGSDGLMKVAAPIVIETSLPRFLAKGDQSNANIEVHNTESTPTELSLEIKADDALGNRSEVLQWTLAADEKQTVQLPLTGSLHQGMGQIQVQAAASSGFKLDRSWRLSLRPAMPAVVDQYKAVLKPTGDYILSSDVFNQFDDMSMKSVLTLSDTAVLNREDHMFNLLQYPYGCLEQTTSRAWPLLYAEAEDYQLYAPAEQSDLFAKRFTVVNGAVSRIMGMQLYSGGFGLWSNNDYEENWLTVYATDFLVQARKLGHEVPAAAMNKAIARLQNYVRNSNHVNSNLAQYLSHRNHFDIAYKAYAAYVLSTMNQVSLQDVRRLFDQFKSQARSPLPLAHLAMSLELLGDERRATEAWQQTMDFKWDRNRYDYYGDYGSKIRDYADVIALGAGSQLLDGLSQSTLDLILPLQQDMSDRNWFSTQERSALFRTAKILKQTSSVGSAWTAELKHNGGATAFKQSADLVQVWRGQPARSGFSVINQGEKPIYLDFKTQGYLKQHKVESNGMVVKKKYFDLNGNQVDLKQVNSGDFLLAHLEISLEEQYKHLPDAMIIDLLPAGLELENQNLEHAMKLDDIKIDGKYVREWNGNTYIKHSEYRDDRFVAALTLSSYQNAHVFYLARAVTPGNYVLPPTLVEDMYRPEIRATSEDMGMIKIK